MNIDDLMKLTGKTREEVEAMLSEDDVISVNLSEKVSRKKESDARIEVVD